MNGADLYSELWQAIDRVRQQHLDRLVALGINKAGVARLGQRQHPFGVARIEWLNNSLFQPAPGGHGAFIQPVFELDGSISDLICWTPDAPLRWGWRLGAAAALGSELLEGPDPVRVVASPLDWLSAGGDALAILDWSRKSPIWSELRGGPPLSFSDPSLRDRVRNHLVQATPLPPMELSYAA